MLIDIFLILVILLSLFILLWIIFSKFPFLARIEIEKIPEEGQKKLKFSILERKIREKIKKLNLKKFFVDKIEKLGKKILALEDKYLLEKQEKILRKEPLKVEQRVEFLIKEGKKSLENNDYLKAEKRFVEAASLDSRNPDIFRNLAKIYFGQKKFPEVEKNLKYVLALTWQSIKWWRKFKRKEEELPKDLVIKLVNSLIDLGAFYKKIEKERKAFHCFRKVLEFEPNNPKILDFLIESSIILKQEKKAEKYLAKLKEVNPENQKIKEWEKRIENIDLPG